MGAPGLDRENQDIDRLIRLAKGGRRSQETAMKNLAQLSEAWLADHPAPFLGLLERLLALPWKNKAALQQLTYFQALALRRCDRYSDALRVFDDLLGQSNLAVELRARSLNSRAVCQRLTGDLEGARQGYHASLALWEGLGDVLNQGKVHLNLGIVYYQLQLYPQAEDYLQTARDLFHAQGSGYWETAAENELGLLYRDAGRWELALVSFEKLVAQRRAAGAADQVGVGLVNIGEIRLFQDHLEGARQAFEAGLQELSADTYRVDALIYLGLVYQVGGQYGPARDYFREALRIAARIERHEILPEVHYRLGELLALLGEHEAALAHFQAAAAEVEAERSPLRDEEFKIGLLGRWQQIYERLVLHCLEMDRVEEAFAWAERARARAFNELVLGARGAQAVPGIKEEDVDPHELARNPPDGQPGIDFLHHWHFIKCWGIIECPAAREQAAPAPIGPRANIVISYQSPGFAGIRLRAGPQSSGSILASGI